MNIRRIILISILSILILLIISYILFLVNLDKIWSDKISNSPYPRAIDTYLYLGDGRYQIYKCLDNYDIYDLKENIEIEPCVYLYYNDENEKTIYTKGSKGYTTVNYQIGYVEQHENLNDFSQQIISIFSNKLFLALKENK